MGITGRFWRNVRTGLYATCTWFDVVIAVMDTVVVYSIARNTSASSFVISSLRLVSIVLLGVPGMWFLRSPIIPRKEKAMIYLLITGVATTSVVMGNPFGLKAVGFAIVTLAAVGPIRSAVAVARLHEDDVLHISDAWGGEYTWHVVSTHGDDTVMCEAGCMHLGCERTLWTMYATDGASWLTTQTGGRLDTIAAARSALGSMRRLEDVDCLTGAIFRLEQPARVIQRAWRIASADPQFSVCKARLQREFGELTRTFDGQD